MNIDKSSSLNILRQELGRFDRRFKVGPARWPHHDLLWIHEGKVRLRVDTDPGEVLIQAPSGILLFPDTGFAGAAVDGAAVASICHFEPGARDDTLAALRAGPGYRTHAAGQALHIQNLIRLSLSYVEGRVDEPVRERLLAAILDCFLMPDSAGSASDEIDRAWALARQRLDRIRALADVAAGIGLSESAFRRRHRQAHGASAGRHLRDMRLNRAEALLATTGTTVREISALVGYAHPESFSAAFTRSRRRSPASYRAWCKRFA